MSCQIKQAPFIQGAVSFKCRVKGLLLREAWLSVIDWTYSNTLRGLINILPIFPIYISIKTMLAKAVSLTKHMVVFSTSKISTYILHAWCEELDTFRENRLQSVVQGDIGHFDANYMTHPTKEGRLRPSKSQLTDNIVNPVQYKHPERREY